MFQIADNCIYDEIKILDIASAKAQGLGEVVNDVFGFYLTKIDPTNDDLSDDGILIYRNRQTYADKKTGSGEDIQAGEKLYYEVAESLVTPNKPSGTAGTEFYFCGWAKEATTAAATKVLMNFDGTRQNEDI